MVAYTKAAIALHNYLRTTESSVYCPPGFTDGEDGEGGEMMINQLEWSLHVTQVIIALLTYLHYLYYYRHSRSASIRDSYKDYFNSNDGEVSWQYADVRRTLKLN